MQHGFIQRRVINAGPVTRRGFLLSSGMALAGCATNRSMSNLDYSETEKMGLNKIDTAINCATVGGQNLITLPAILDFTQIATEQQIVPGWGHFIGAGITLDASNLSAFGILKSIAVTLYTGVNPDLVGPQQFVGKIWIFNPQTQQVICIVPGDATYQNAPNGANTYSTSQVIDLIPSTSSKLVIYSEVAGLAGTPSTVTGSINLNNFHLFV